MRHAVVRGFKQQLDAVRRVLRARLKAAQQDDALLEEVASVLAPQVLRPPMTRIATQAWLLGARSANEEFEVSPGVGPTAPELDAYVEDVLRPSIAGIHAFTSDRILHIVASDLAAGIGIAAILAEIEGQRDAGVFSLARASGIGRYEPEHAFLDGRRSAVRTHARRAGKRVEKQWETVGDVRVEEVCEQNERAGWIPDEEPYPSGHDGPLAHNRCRCGERHRLIDT